MDWQTIKEAKRFDDANDATDYIHYLYGKSVNGIRDAFERFAKSGSAPDDHPENHHYPFVGIDVTAKDLFVDPSFAYGVISEPGRYGTTVTEPELFDAYYREQIGLLIERHRVPVTVGYGEWPIPLPFVPERDRVGLDADALTKSQSKFVLPDLKRVNDNLANATFKPATDFLPLSLFPGERVDFSLQRLRHYTGTQPKHFQNFLLLTNYQRYVDEFVEHASNLIANHPLEDWELVGPGDTVMASKRGKVDLPPAHLPQMPAFHFKQKNRDGVTMVNIGVGPSNAKTITDHLAVLRPHCWIMLGHCAGLRASQTLGDYVLADSYVREDHVLDSDLPPWVPVPPIAEIQQAFQQAVARVAGKREGDLKSSIRTGTVLTTDNRNWELQSEQFYEKFRQSRAIAVDMESATIAANGFRFRVPYGALLCVSDKPIHGVIKLQGMANAFYRNRIHQHLAVGLESIEILKKMDSQRLHSRKLRGFDESPFR